jgi:hypothetical protein
VFVVAGLVRNVRTDTDVRTALRNAGAIRSSAMVQVTPSEGTGPIELRITSANTKALACSLKHPTPAEPIPVEWEVLLDGKDSSCQCPAFLRGGICKHIVYGLRKVHKASDPEIYR